MPDVDSSTLLEWLGMGQGDERDMQLTALEQLCMLLLMSDNVDRCFESCPPRSFLPALCRIFLDPQAPEQVLEVTARAFTYYVDVSADCTRRIVAVPGTIAAICERLSLEADASRTSRDLAEQCVKVLEFICTCEAGAIFDVGGLRSVLQLIRNHGVHLHKDTLQSAMNVVGRLCSKMEPQDPQLPSSVEALSQLLSSHEQSVSDGALRCFASLADRFMRRSVDPAPLIKHDLLPLLLKRLFAIPGAVAPTDATVSDSNTDSSAASTSLSTTPILATSPSTLATIGAGSNVLDARTAQTIATVLSLLSTLCRASPTITTQLLEQPLADAIQCALQGNDRCVLDTMRLIDLLLLLLFEGRQALPKCSSSSSSSKSSSKNVGSSFSSSRRDGPGERAHLQLIDCIRCKDTDGFIQAIQNGNVEINLTDEVGQTLLNWASAFGTQEMVEYLIEKGADVNRGQRSSSLHYASSFGRPAIVKILLRHGANPDLRDEQGKTPLDKAREHKDPGHREVAAILHAPAEYMRNPSSSTQGECNSDDPTVCGNPDQALIYLRRLLPMLCQTYQNSMMRTLRTASLTLIRKMANYATSAQLRTLANEGDSCVLLVDVIALFLDDDESDENIYPVLQTIQRLVNKSSDVFVDLFLRLGVFQKLQALAGSSHETYSNPSNLIEQPLIISKSEAAQLQPVGKESSEKSNSTDLPVEDSQEIAISKPYYWRDWNIVRGRDCLYLWNEYVAIELSSGSNGWFRFMIDGRLATMYSSGSPEAGSESAECQSEFIEKIQRCKSTVKSGTKPQPILSSASNLTHQIGKWTLGSRQEGHLTITNGDGASQCTTLNEKINGFLFESNRGTRHTFQAETVLISELSGGWAPSSGSNHSRPVRTKAEIQKQKVQQLARELIEGRLKHALHDSNAPLRQLNVIVRQINKCCEQLNLVAPSSLASLAEQSTSSSDDSDQSNSDCGSDSDRTQDEGRSHQVQSAFVRLRAALTKLAQLLSEERALSAFELHSSGLIQALAQALEIPKDVQSSSLTTIQKTIKRNRQIFIETFIKSNSTAALLVRKLVNVLESSEKLPILTYDSSSCSLQVLIRRFRLRLLKEASESAHLLDRTDNCLRAEPLATVGQLQRHLWQTVAQQWYDNPRSSLHFVHLLKQHSRTKPLQLNHKSDFDQNGLIYWIGTDGLQNADWINPARANLMLITCSDGKNLPYGRLQDILSRDSNPLNCHTNDDRNAWFCIDLGVWLLPTAYTLRHARGYNKSALRNWQLLVSKDGIHWKCARKHTDDKSLREWGSTATWKLDPIPNAGDGWRYVCIQQSGRNASGQYHYLSLSGFEIYGQVTGACDQLHAQVRDPELSVRRLRKQIKQQLKQLKAGVRVMRGPDWKWKQQDSNGVGTVLSACRNGWIDVRWDNGFWNLYRMGADNKYDLRIVTGSEAAATTPLTDLSVVDNRLNNRHERLNISETDSQLSNEDSCSSLKSEELGALQRKFSLGSKRHSESTSRKSSSTSSLLDNTDNGTSGSRHSASSNSNRVTVACTEQASSADSLLLKPGDSLLARNKAEPNLEGAQCCSLLNMVGLSPTQEETEESLAESEELEKKPNKSQSNFSSEHHHSSNETSFNDCCVASSCDSTASSSKMLGDEFECAQFSTSVSGDSGAQTPVTSTSGPISVSVPNLALNERDSLNQSALGLLETFASAATLRRTSQLNNLQNSLNSLTQGSEVRSQSSSSDAESSMCRIMRFALTPNFPELLADFLEEITIANSHSQDSPNAQDPNSDIVSVPQTIAFQLLNDSRLTDNDGSDVADSCHHNESSSDIQINEADDDDLNESDEENEDDENEDDNYEFMLDDYDLRSAQKRRYWDEEYVLKRQVSALIPAFDPRPGRTNVNQTVDFPIDPPSSDPFEPLPSKFESDQLVFFSKNNDQNPKMLLSIRMSSLSNEGDLEIDLINPSWTLFAAIQQLLQASITNSRQQKVIRAWESTYTLVYKEWPTEYCDIDPNLPIHRAPVKLITSNGAVSQIASNCESSVTSIENTLELLRILHQLKNEMNVVEGVEFLEEAEKGLPITSEDFVSKKVTNKLMQQMFDPLIMTSGAQPYWCNYLVHRYPMLFPFDARQTYFQALAFGISRTLVWLQSQRDSNRLHGPSPRREEHEYQLGRLLHERVKVPRFDRLFDWAVEVMQKTAHRKSILEVEFQNEEGTGLGPTLEFYALVALELQLKSHKMWLCDDVLLDDNKNQYVHHSAGLFPAPLPPSHPTTSRVCQLFHFLGIFIAKALQDNRLVDLPLSLPFLKLICHANYDEENHDDSFESSDCESKLSVAFANKHESKSRRYSPEEQLILERGEAAKHAHCKAQRFAEQQIGSFGGLLNEKDFLSLYPHKAKFFQQLQALIKSKQQILEDSTLSLEEKQCQLRNLYIPMFQSDIPIRLESLGLTFQYLPTSSVYGFDAIDLKPSGEFEDVTIENVEDYYESMLSFCLNAGIAEQMKAFRSGFNRVFPIHKLSAFQPEELLLMLCGEQNPQWTKEEIIAYTEPKLGFTKTSPGFLKLVNVLCDMSGSERKDFLQFATGCSSLPPGGLANLHPRLTIVKKVDANDGSYPSVNTCAHYLKLPDYSSEQVLRERLLHATIEKGFHLN